MSAEALLDRPPTHEEAREASEVLRVLAKALTPQGLSFVVSRNGNEIRLELPPTLGQLLLDVLAHVARGEMVKIVPYGAILSTKEAADLLNVSRPFLVGLLEAGKIPFRRVGSHRRVKVDDVLAYEADRDGERRKALDDVQQLGQEFDTA